MSADLNTDQPDRLPKRTNNIQVHQRTYKACLPCRKRKAKCDLGEAGVPPCARCRREMRECIFSIDRSSNGNKRRRLSRSSDQEDNTSQTSPIVTNNRLESFQSHDVIVVPTRSTGRTQVLESEVQKTYQPPDHSLADNRARASASNGFPEKSSTLESQPTSRPGLGDSVIRTVVSSGNDALKILFEAATQDADDGETAMDTPHGNIIDTSGDSIANNGTTYELHNDSPLTEKRFHTTSNFEAETLKLWNNFGFVRMGWFSAYEAINYIDLFFQNMWPLSPILTDAFSDHSMHNQLVTQEPLLCCTLLMISSRYHTLPGPSGVSRSFFIHDQLWEHCQRMIMRIIFGQDKGTPTKTRTIGSIEALLLISEWHPRSLHFPPKVDGWGDPDLLIGEPEQTSMEKLTPGQKWLEDVIEPARRSDRMSWMLLGCAVSLAHELDVFRDEEKLVTSVNNEITLTRRLRIRNLLYVYTTQLASRLGCTSMYPQHISNCMTGTSLPAHSPRWDAFMSSWTELTRLLKSWSDLVFPSAAVTKQLLHTGRYVSLLEHYKPLIEQWRKKNLGWTETGDTFQAMLTVEFELLRIYCNSLGMQAVCEKSLGEAAFDTDFALSVDSIDHECIQEVIEGGCSILKTLIALAESDTLRFAPVRVFLRVTTASIFLLKAISLGVRNSQLLSTFNLLDRSIRALRSGNLDEMHLALRYATLLETHVTRLRRGFQRSSKPTFSSIPLTRQASNEGTRSRSVVDPAPALLDGDTADPTVESSDIQPAVNDLDAFLQNLSADDWLSLPFDPSMAPFNTNDSQAFPAAFDDTTLDFIWNIPT